MKAALQLIWQCVLWSAFTAFVFVVVSLLAQDYINWSIWWVIPLAGIPCGAYNYFAITHWEKKE